MNTKKDEPGKEAGAGGGSSGGRPHATLDLKATEVDPGPGKTDRASSAGETAAPSKDATMPHPDNFAGPAGAEPPSGGGFFTHLAAGIAGGIVALLAADILSSQLGLTGSSEGNAPTAALEQRLSALEASTRQPAGTPPQLDSRLAAAEARLDKLEPLAGTVGGLEQRQTELGNALKAAQTALDAQTGDKTMAGRVAKLEDQLATMSAAAVNDPQSGPLPQLAALTGRIADLESKLTGQIDAFRKSVNDEIDTRLSTASEASETAKSSTERFERDLSDIKGQIAQFGASLGTVRTENDRITAALRNAEDTLARLKTDTEARMATFAKREDVTTAVAPVSGKLSELETNVGSVMKNEEARKATAERIVLSLELANLKRAIDRGGAYANELAQARKATNAGIDLEPLAKFASTGVPTLSELRQEFRTVAFKMIDANEEPAQGSLVDRLLAGARSVVRVRKTSHGAGDTSVEAVVARMEASLSEGQLGSVLEEAKALPQPARDAAQDFLAKVEARNTADRALAAVEEQLKASLVAPTSAPSAAQE
jgi:hypothetical protein